MIKRSRLAQGVARTTIDHIPFGFGLDQVTPSNQTRPGSLRECKNVQIDINGGYQTASGYLKFDGTQPVETNTYYVIEFEDGTGDLIAAGDTITEATGPTTAYVLAVNTEVEGFRYLVLADVDGPELEAGQILTYSGGTVTTLGDQATGGAHTSQLNAQYKQLASIYWQGFVGAVPGEGDILGIVLSHGTVFAFRNNEGETAAVMHKSTVNGWEAIDLGLEIAFTSGGTQEILDGDTITGMTSAATADVLRVVLESGSWAAGTAAGRLILTDQSGTFVAENIEVSGSGNLATIAGNSAAITLLPGGRYEFWEHNFQSSGNRRLYGCDGVNYGFEFDPVSEVFVPIHTGLEDDAPTHVVVHSDHLFFAYGSSALHSGIGAPYNWTALAGAAELGAGDTVTAYKIQPGAQGGSTLAIFTRNRIKMLYGSNSGDPSEGGWNLVDYRAEVGALPYSVQEFGMTLMMDDRGITTLRAMQDFGNFTSNVISKYVQPFINSRKRLVVDSCINRERSQYRLFFSDKTALYVTTENNKILGVMPQEFAHDVKCVTSGEVDTGGEETYFGSSDGWVYKMDTGTSFAGEDIEVLMSLHFHHAKSPRIEKSYFDASFEVSGDQYANFNFRYELSYNLSTTPQPENAPLDVNFSSAVWDEFVWDEFVWDGVVLSPSVVELNGSGENISLIFSSLSNYSYALTFSSASIRMAYRNQLRS